MGFDKTEASQLLADCGRHCCICGDLHRVQVHHIVPGDDRIENGIPLCPPCHDEVHIDYSQGRTTRVYTPAELKMHRKRTIDLTKKEGKWRPGSAEWRKDKRLITFFAQCLDRPAFRTYFHNELSFVDFDDAMQDTILALNTGYWKTRDGTVLERSLGKACVVNPQWREKLDKIATIIEEIRKRFADAVGLNRMLLHLRGLSGFEPHDTAFRRDRDLSDWMDAKRQEAIDTMNTILRDLQMQPLSNLRT
ncbi:MAG: HNH endonuclease signature motif containing protein [Thermodesulfovibrionales bacterium]